MKVEESVMTTITVKETYYNDDKDDDGQISSAASCIRFLIPRRNNEKEEVVGTTYTTCSSNNYYDFHPVYTHQIFPEEYIPDYHPIAPAEPSLSHEQEQQQQQPQQQQRPSHPSFQYPTRHGLRFDIELVPSCAYCNVNITIQPHHRPRSTKISSDQCNDRIDETHAASEGTHNHHSVIQNSSKKRNLDTLMKESQENDDENNNSNIIDSNLSEIVASVQSILWTQLQPFLPPILQSTIRISTNPPFVGETRKGITTATLPSSPLSPLASSLLSSPYLEQPYGTILQEYTHPRSPDSSTNTCTSGNTTETAAHFCITLWENGTTASSTTEAPEDGTHYFNHAVQKLAYYYIENASEVNIHQSSWKVLYVFRKHTTNTTTTSTSTVPTTTPTTTGTATAAASIDTKHQYCYSFVGYMTLYYFRNPFRKPVGGTIIRICQVLILPPYQRQSHGQHLLQALYQKYDTDPTIVEINVEDPVPAFTYLRLLIDYQRYRKYFPHGYRPSQQHSNNYSSIDDNCDNATATTTTTASISIHDESFFKYNHNIMLLSPLQSVLKTTTVQVQMILEIDQLRQLQQYIQECTGTTGCSTNHDAENNDDDHGRIALYTKRYRLMVKQRLYEQNNDCFEESNKKEQLDRLYRTLHQQYERILTKTI